MATEDISQRAIRAWTESETLKRMYDQARYDGSPIYLTYEQIGELRDAESRRVMALPPAPFNYAVQMGGQVGYLAGVSVVPVASVEESTPYKMRLIADSNTEETP